MQTLSQLWGTVRQQKKLFLDILFLAAVMLLARIIIVPHLDQLRHLIDGLGLLGPVLFLGVSAALVILFVQPILSIGLGSLAFGKIVGACYSLLGVTAGACAAFLLGRHVFGQFAAKLKRGPFKKIDEVANHNGLLFVISLRLVFFCIPPLNYMAGTTVVTFKAYFLGTLIGIAPRLFIVSFVFESLQNLSTIQASLLNPSFLLLVLLPLTRLVGISLLAILTRSRGREVAIR